MGSDCQYADMKNPGTVSLVGCNSFSPHFTNTSMSLQPGTQDEHSGVSVEGEGSKTSRVPRKLALGLIVVSPMIDNLL